MPTALVIACITEALGIVLVSPLPRQVSGRKVMLCKRIYLHYLEART